MITTAATISNLVFDETNVSRVSNLMLHVHDRSDNLSVTLA